MSSLENFDASVVAPATGFEIIPVGKYTAIIEETEMKITKKGDGKYLQLQWQIVDGSHAGRKIWSRLTFSNPSATAQNIGRAELSSVCRAVGCMQPKDSSELCNRPARITVGHEKRSDTGEMTNVITKYESVNGETTQAADAAVAKVNEPKKAPWAK